MAGQRWSKLLLLLKEGQLWYRHLTPKACVQLQNSTSEHFAVLARLIERSARLKCLLSLAKAEHAVARLISNPGRDQPPQDLLTPNHHECSTTTGDLKATKPFDSHTQFYSIACFPLVQLLPSRRVRKLLYSDSDRQLAIISCV